MIKKIIKNYPIFIAEISANHNGKIKNAKKLILDAKKYGADYVKLQTYTPDSMTFNSNYRDFIIKKGIWKGKNLWELYKKAQTPFAWQKELFNYSKKIGIKCFSTPFDESAVDLLESLKCPIYKIASFELNHIPLIEKVAKTKKNIILSTGMANLHEIDLAYETAIKHGNEKRIILLYCVSNYPAKVIDFNLGKILFLKERYKCEVGFSDHSNNNDIAKAAVIAGAKIFEKHIALKNVKGPDYNFSLKDKEISTYIKDIRASSKLLGNNKFTISNSERNYKNYRRSIYASKDIKIGEKFSDQNIKIIRPGYGLDPKYYNLLINRKSPLNIKKFKRISRDIIKKL